MSVVDRYIDYETRLAEGRLGELRRYAEGERLARSLRAERTTLGTRWPRLTRPRAGADLATLAVLPDPSPVGEAERRRCA